MIFALTSVVVFGIVGGAIDFGRALSARAQTMNALDSAVLAAGRILQLPGKTHGDAIQHATTYYTQHRSKLLDTDTPVFEVVNGGTAVRGRATGSIKTPFLSIVGIETLDMTGSARAELAAGGNSGSHVEVSMMLDVTGSMSGQKMADLKLAAKDLVDIVVWADQSEFTSKVAIAPFSEHVNVGRALFKTVTGATPTGSGDARTCVRERRTADRYTDEPPSSGNYFERGPTSGTCKPQSTVVPLTNNKSDLKAEIDALDTTGYTAGHLGTAWAWYLLSPNWSSVWPTWSQPRPYSDITTKGPKGHALLQKIAVLMTDGEYNRQYSGASSATQARELCSQMKAKGVQVYTVGFQIDAGGEAEETLRQCATNLEYFYNAGDGETLRAAFRDIALKIATLRLAE